MAIGRVRSKQLPLVLLILLSADIAANAKEWRGIIPLKSTRVDVERLLGKPTESGRYEFKEEKATIMYSGGPCDRKQNCECLVAEDTVLAIHVIPQVKIRFSKLSLAKSQYKRFKSSPDMPSVTYINTTEGLRYMINERLDSVENIDFLPSAKDCQGLVGRILIPVNQWRGIRPLFSTREDVENLL